MDNALENYTQELKKLKNVTTITSSLTPFKRAMAKRLMEILPGASERFIATVAGVSNQTISQWRKKEVQSE